MNTNEFMQQIKKVIDKPITPYAGTSGWSGSDTSKDRATTGDADGTTTDRQQLIILNLFKAKEQGLTWHEVAVLNGWHHGIASGGLSVLHKVGIIARLKERRNKSAVYVLPEHINGREVSERKIKTCQNCGHTL